MADRQPGAFWATDGLKSGPLLVTAPSEKKKKKTEVTVFYEVYGFLNFLVS